MRLLKGELHHLASRRDKADNDDKGNPDRARSAQRRGSSFWSDRPFLLGSAVIVVVLFLFGLSHPQALGSFYLITLGALPPWLVAALSHRVAKAPPSS